MLRLQRNPRRPVSYTHPCGDPNLETTAKIVREAVANGADLIELGIPFSDPTAEGTRCV